jgi:hypothetical protein
MASERNEGSNTRQRLQVRFRAERFRAVKAWGPIKLIAPPPMMIRRALLGLFRP